jgi:hypothetical protein
MLENYIFYISRMYEFSHSLGQKQTNHLAPKSTDVGYCPRLCENGSARRSGARLIQTECRWRMKDSPRRQVRFFCCVLTTVGSVFTQPSPKADIPRGTYSAARLS